jgi:hypothetical protein
VGDRRAEAQAGGQGGRRACATNYGVIAFASFDDFVYYYRIYEATDAMWHAWNAAQDYEVEDFEEAVPDSIIILKS